jgi:hypothetical protein
MDLSKIEKLTSREDSEVKRLIELFDSNKGIPTFFDLPDYIDFAERVDKTINFISKSNDARLIVLETWLIVDYSIRHILKYGLEIDRFCDENYNILPQGFRDCAKLLQDLIKYQKDKESNTSKKLIFLPYEFKMAIYEDKAFFKKFIQFEEEYYKKFNIPISFDYDDLRNNKLRNVDEGWLKAVEKLTEMWFEKADKLNRVRNYAIHSFDENKIFKELGLNGNNKIGKLKKYCIESLKDLIGVK